MFAIQRWSQDACKEGIFLIESSSFALLVCSYYCNTPLNEPVYSRKVKEKWEKKEDVMAYLPFLHPCRSTLWGQPKGSFRAMLFLLYSLLQSAEERTGRCMKKPWLYVPLKLKLHPQNQEKNACLKDKSNVQFLRVWFVSWAETESKLSWKYQILSLLTGTGSLLVAISSKMMA